MATETKSVLVRKPLAVPLEEPLPVDVSELWKQELGYHGPSADLHAKLRRLTAEAFASMAFSPLCPNAVSRYKASKVENWKHGLAWNAGFIGFFLLVFSVIVGLVSLFGDSGEAGYAVVAACIGAVVLVGAFVFLTWVLPFAEHGARWRLRELKQHVKPVPRWALQTALETKKALEAKGVLCSFYVDELTQNPDPFLVVQVGIEHAPGRCFWDDWHYLEAWDEPSFNVERQI